jgi:hypothetical protein
MRGSSSWSRKPGSCRRKPVRDWQRLTRKAQQISCEEESATSGRTTYCAIIRPRFVAHRRRRAGVQFCPRLTGPTAMLKIAIDWTAYDLKEKAFEQALAEGKATLVDHPLPNGGVLGKATCDQIAHAAKQFENRGQDLLALAEWLRAKRSLPTPSLTGLQRLSNALAARARAKASGESGRGRRQA